ncbi:MAG: peptidoglycan editing factor PgeF [Terriglobales bacterium]
MPSTRATQPKLNTIRAENFADLAWLRHGFSTRAGGVSDCYGPGSLSLGITQEDTRENVQRNRELFFREIGATGTKGKPWPSVAMKQIHSSVVHTILRIPEHPLAGDGLITREPGLVLTVRTADCIPVLLVDPEQRAVGAFHAGWRGTLARIVEKGVGEMRRAFGSQPEHLQAAIGPGIHRCCYEVSEDLKEKFASQFSYADALFEEVFSSDPVHDKYPLLFLNMRAPGHGDPPCTPHLDLIEANRRQLLDAGVPAENIWISDLCTSCRTDLLFSHRKEKGRTGRMVAAVAISC